MPAKATDAVNVGTISVGTFVPNAQNGRELEALLGMLPSHLRMSEGKLIGSAKACLQGQQVRLDQAPLYFRRVDVAVMLNGAHFRWSFELRTARLNSLARDHGVSSRAL